MRRKIEIPLDKVEQLAQVCDSEADIARALGISIATLGRRKKDSDDFAEALKRGQAKAHVFVAGKLMEAIKAGNIAATIFYLKTQCHWHEQLDVRATNVEPVTVKLVDDLKD